MAKIKGVKGVLATLKKLEGDAQEASKAGATVGYTQSYALFVHEGVDMNFNNGKQAKYLETPARNLKKELARIITAGYAKSKDLNKSLFVAGLRLQRESMKIVPIDTGALRASAFTALIDEEDKVAKESFQKSEAIRKASQNQ